MVAEVDLRRRDEQEDHRVRFGSSGPLEAVVCGSGPVGTGEHAVSTDPDDLVRGHLDRAGPTVSGWIAWCPVVVTPPSSRLDQEIRPR